MDENKEFDEVDLDKTYNIGDIKAITYFNDNFYILANKLGN